MTLIVESSVDDLSNCLHQSKWSCLTAKLLTYLPSSRRASNNRRLIPGRPFPKQWRQSLLPLHMRWLSRRTLNKWERRRAGKAISPFTPFATEYGNESGQGWGSSSWKRTKLHSARLFIGEVERLSMINQSTLKREDIPNHSQDSRALMLHFLLHLCQLWFAHIFIFLLNNIHPNTYVSGLSLALAITP